MTAESQQVDGAGEPVPVLTVDGPSGSGKGTISRAVAARLGWHFLDSGALYRAVGVAAGWEDADLGDTEGLVALTHRTQVQFVDDPGGEPHVLNVRPVCTELRRRMELADGDGQVTPDRILACLRSMSESFGSSWLRRVL